MYPAEREDGAAPQATSEMPGRPEMKVIRPALSVQATTAIGPIPFPANQGNYPASRREETVRAVHAELPAAVSRLDGRAEFGLSSLLR